MREPTSWEHVYAVTLVMTDGSVERVVYRERGEFVVFEPDCIVVAKQAKLPETPPNTVFVGPLPLRALRRIPACRVREVIYEYTTPNF